MIRVVILFVLCNMCALAASESKLAVASAKEQQGVVVLHHAATVHNHAVAIDVPAPPPQGRGWRATCARLTGVTCYYGIGLGLLVVGGYKLTTADSWREAIGWGSCVIVGGSMFTSCLPRCACLDAVLDRHRVAVAPPPG